MNRFGDLMAPFGKEHCMYFYYLGYIALMFTFVALIIGVISIFKKNYKTLGSAFSYFLTGIIAYYVYRISYSVCSSALK